MSKFVDKVVRHICTMVFCRLMACLSMEGCKGKIREKTRVDIFYLILCQNDLHLTFTERVPNLAEQVAYQR